MDGQSLSIDTFVGKLTPRVSRRCWRISIPGRKLLPMSIPRSPNEWRAVASEGDRCVALAGFTVTETRRRSSVLPPHAHEQTNLGLCVSGMFEETLGGRRLTVSPATLIGRPAGEVHANRYGSTPAHCLIIELRPPTVARLKDATALLEQSFVMEAVFVTVTAHRIRAELRRRDEVTPLVLESLVHELVAEAHRTRRRCIRERRRAPWLDHTVELLRGCTHGPRTERIGLAEVAAQVGVHPCHLARVFRREFGCSVGEYVRLHRLEEAARLLRTGTLSLSSIALATGFADQSHLTNSFRRRFGMTPGQFRRLAAGK